MFKLMRHFSVMSALATAAITTVFVIAYYWTETRNLNRLVEDRNVAQAYAFAGTIWPKYANHIADSRNRTGDQLRALPVTQELHEEMRRLTRGTPVLKINIFNIAGNTVYSSTPHQIGTSYSNEIAFKRATATGQVSTAVSRRNILDTFGTNHFDRSVAESYVPMRDDAGNLRGVVELYTDITPSADQIQRELWTFCAMLVGALAALYVVLLLVVRRADCILVRQYKELETFSQRLEEKVSERTNRLLSQQSVLSWITNSESFRHGDLEIACRELTRITAGALGVEQVSIWRFNTDRSEIRSVDRYTTSTSRHSDGHVVPVERYQAYFDVLQREEYIAANDAESDPRLGPLKKDHILTRGIGSALDVPISQGGRIEGVLAIEHVGAPIVWSAEQKLFAVAIANFASLALERHERFKVEADLREANRSVEAANRAKSLFLANMSHEIRTPMNGVFGMTDLLMRTELSDRQRKYVGVISSSAKRLLTIINDILDLSRIESGKLELDTHDFSFRSCVEETIDLLAGEAQRKNLDLSLFIAGDVPKAISGDSGRLRQILTNLVSNSIKFTHAGDVAVRIVCEGTQNGKATLRFEVRDTGIGIPEDIQRRLFMPFQQADTSISRRFGGTGLGLSIARHLVELMGGRITLTSEPGKGTTIAFTSVVTIGEDASIAGTETIHHGSLADRRILVVDDRQTNREMILTYLAECGARASGVGSAKAAIDELTEAESAGDSYALAIVDMVMPEVNGLEFAQIVRARPALAGLRLVMLTSMSWKGDARTARELGYGALLTKPVHRDELIKTAAQQLARDTAPVADSDCTQPITTEQLNLGLRVLLAEDNPVNYEVAREYLTALGCEVFAAENGIKAVEAMRTRTFDLVLMDCQMPEMDGLEATRQIREMEVAMNRKPTTIVAVTANAFAEDRAQCLEAGMDDYMSKPFSEEQLRQMLLRWGIESKRSPALTVVTTAAPAVKQSGAAPAAPASTPVVPPQHLSTVTSDAVAKALDTEMLRRMQKTYPTLLARLLGTYLDYAPNAMQQLMVALVAEDHNQLKTTAHSLKSSSANVGATALSALCRDLEHRLKTTTEWDGAANRVAVTEIESAYLAAVAAIAPLRAELDMAKPSAPAPAKSVGA